MILPSIEDENRYSAPPEPYEDDLHDCEPEDDIDWLEKNFGDNEKDHSPIGAVGASNTEPNLAAPIG